jgi:hypothetical protein
VTSSVVRALRSPEVQARPIWPHTDEAGEKERRVEECVICSRCSRVADVLKPETIFGPNFFTRINKVL